MGVEIFSVVRGIAGGRQLADRYHISPVIIHHFSKARGVDYVLDRISGTAAIQAAPHSLIAYNGKRGHRGGKICGGSKETKLSV